MIMKTFTLSIMFVFWFVVAFAITPMQKNKVLLRGIADEFLLQSGDSTSRILSIEKVENKYQISFENQFSFDPDLLFFSIYKMLEQTNVDATYLVEVVPCATQQIVHSFQISLNKKTNLTPCKGRVLPKDCYRFYFTVVAPQKTAKNNYWLWSTVAVVSVFIVFFIFLRKKPKPTNAITLGDYYFYSDQMLLSYKNNQSVELSSKESELLLLLYKQRNQTIDRTTILKQIWSDNGSYNGRTLDVYISKLRKLLVEDATVKILNIRGVGYRLCVEVN